MSFNLEEAVGITTHRLKRKHEGEFILDELPPLTMMLMKMIEEQAISGEMKENFVVKTLLQLYEDPKIKQLCINTISTFMQLDKGAIKINGSRIKKIVLMCLPFLKRRFR